MGNGHFLHQTWSVLEGGGGLGRTIKAAFNKKKLEGITQKMNTACSTMQPTGGNPLLTTDKTFQKPLKQIALKMLKLT